MKGTAPVDQAGEEPGARRVLLVEDNPGDAELVRAALDEAERRVELDHVERLDQALVRLSARGADAVLLDLSLPDANGLEGVERIRVAHSDLPIVVLTGGSPGSARDALRAGAQDYLWKGELDGHAVERAIEHAIERQRHAEREQELAAERGARQAMETGARLLELANQRLTLAVQEAREAGERETAARLEAEQEREAYKKLSEQLALAQKVGRSGTFDWDATRDVNAWSGELLSLYGLRPEEFGGRHEDWIECLVPPDREAAAAAVARSLQTGELAMEFRIRRRDTGEIRWIEGRGQVFFDAAGRPARMIGIHVDVTERKYTEEDVLRTHERAAGLARFPEENPDPVLRLSSDLAVLYANDSARSSLRELGLLPGLPAPAALAEPAREALAAGRRIRREIRSGDRWFAMTFSPVEVEVNVFGQDITTRKAAEAERDKLVEALRQADRRKTEFLAMLSHELRNPLAPIRNSIYILDRAAPGGEQARRAHAVIDRQVHHLTRLVDDLLDMTRISRGKVRLQRVGVDLRALARHIVEDHRELFARNGVGLDVVGSEEPILVYADPTRLAQVVGNLLQNAAKFTPRGGRTTLAAERIEGFGVVTVRDTGGGILPEVLPQLFEPFVQAERTLDRSAGGLGLGLALVKGLVELHGGSVSAHSEGPGRGAAFVVRFPLERRSAPRSAAVPGLPARGFARRLLVIEDNVDAAESLKEALELNDHVVEIAHTGIEGVEKARALRPDVVLCDIGLPGMDGFQVATTLRADPGLSAVALVALSGYAQPEDLEKSMRSGFDLHLAKPLDLETLERAMAHLRPAAPASAWTSRSGAG